ncbi:MAG: heparan-alpha-glucosaminide N-acetyltransferase domain-containing protein [Bacteroidota bacterium]|uniref:Heparan-alpha-glucosaminide N-acetyltransferase domain-containing protein n=1 Tax=Flagellimonas okinawensis TaxID=3031324 RepID=A0ABT5XIY8_9FLAO|nr:heparan-alpha-glucosaminide N-acetyltransferase domain-containing protein [[Muricauda] okinawensis]MDF0705857.1 heparan-alpha-glucosaminide N-acetyltransferase domain-containing protein [[Muricauda] okinawensis]MEC8832616.1 heparan-alpha-glucosaminide N-acetyltransferase domain-containing protein [Bacteroidota bacterium]
MAVKSNRLFFVDAMRAWAILMMLQGHFIDGLLDPVFRDSSNTAYSIWLYFRGITAPVFFTVSGFIFTYLLIRVPENGVENPRVKKGIRRGLQLLAIGYLLRLNLGGLLKGQIYNAFYLVDVLHCIGLSILGLVGLYVLTAKKKKFVFPTALVVVTLVLFLFERVYKDWSFAFLPDFLANYFTKSNGSVFTIIPWFGYTTIGAFISVLFTRFKNYRYLYPAAISIALVTGYLLIYQSSAAFAILYDWTGFEFLKLILSNNYLFIRLGNVFVVFAVFMILRQLMTNKTVLKIGASTLSIYVIHFIILYGSFTGLGLYGFFNHSLSPEIVIPGALAFMVACTFLALQYNKYEAYIKVQVGLGIVFVKGQLIEAKELSAPMAKEILIKARLVLRRVLRTVRS